MFRTISVCVGLLILISVSVAQSYRPEPVMVSKNVLRAYDRFHDRTTVMLKAFPVSATIGKDHYLLSMAAGFAFDTKMPAKRPVSILLFFKESPWTATSAAESLEDTRPRPNGENLYLSRQSEVIALLDGERIKLPHGNEGEDFNAGTGTGGSVVLEVPIAAYRRMAQAKKLEFLIGDLIAEPYMKKTTERLVEMADYVESIQVGK